MKEKIIKILKDINYKNVGIYTLGAGASGLLIFGLTLLIGYLLFLYVGYSSLDINNGNDFLVMSYTTLAGIVAGLLFTFFSSLLVFRLIKIKFFKKTNFDLKSFIIMIVGFQIYFKFWLYGSELDIVSVLGSLKDGDWSAPIPAITLYTMFFGGVYFGTRTLRKK